MSNYKSPEKRASHMVTFRLTQQDKYLLDQVAAHSHRTRTDLLRTWIHDAARAHGIQYDPAPAPSLPDRPSRAPQTNAPARSPREDAPWEQRVQQLAAAQPHSVAAVFATALRHFADHRTPAVQQELRDTLVAVSAPDQLGWMPLDLPISRVDGPFLDTVRERLRTAELPFRIKNRILTYLRMTCNLAIKQGYSMGTSHPASHLASFSAKEVADALPRYIKSP